MDSIITNMHYPFQHVCPKVTKNIDKSETINYEKRDDHKTCVMNFWQTLQELCSLMFGLGFQAERRNRSHVQMTRLDKELHKLILKTGILYVSEMIVMTSDVFFYNQIENKWICLFLSGQYKAQLKYIPTKQNKKKKKNGFQHPAPA